MYQTAGNWMGGAGRLWGWDVGFWSWRAVPVDGVCDWGLGDGWVGEWWVVGGNMGEVGLGEADVNADRV